MAITREQVMSYGISGGTGATGWVAQTASDAEQSVDWAIYAADVAGWSVMDYLTAGCMVLGAAGVLLRMYVDWSAHRDRKKRIKQLAKDYSCPPSVR